MSVFACTRDRRLARVERDGASWRVETLLDDVAAQCVAADDTGRVLVGTNGDAALLSADDPDRWYASAATGSIMAMASPTGLHD